MRDRSDSLLTLRIAPYSIRLFVSAARAGSILRAAEQEHIAASASSRRLTDLEHAFGTDLLVRSPRGVVLTDAGRLVFDRSAKLDDDLQALLREVQSEAGEVRGTVRLHANMSAVIGVLPERLQGFLGRHPGAKVSVHEADTRDVIRACLDDRRRGCRRGDTYDPSLDAWHFADDPLQVVLPLGHALEAARTIGFARALAYQVIGVHQGGVLHERAEVMRMKFAPTV